MAVRTLDLEDDLAKLEYIDEVSTSLVGHMTVT